MELDWVPGDWKSRDNEGVDGERYARKREMEQVGTSPIGDDVEDWSGNLVF